MEPQKKRLLESVLSKKELKRHYKFMHDPKTGTMLIAADGFLRIGINN